MPRSVHGGRHELGQNFLTHRPTIRVITDLLAETRGPILELGAGDGALTRPLAAMGRPLTAIDIDEHRVRRLARALPTVDVRHADALTHPFTTPVVVGNIPFHLTTPLLRRLLGQPHWTRAVLVTQWEVARKRAGVGGHTMMTAQSGPWFTFALAGRVPRSGFAPQPSVDGGILAITRRGSPLVPHGDRARYERFVREVFTGRGAGLDVVVGSATRLGRARARRMLGDAGVSPRALPRDIPPETWASLWRATRA
jgi:23S rRNA (adenine-N6)-dimethyltransferase